MRGIPSSFFIIFFILVFFVELTSYFGFRLLIGQTKKEIRKISTILYLILSLSISGLLFFSFSNPELLRHSDNYSFFFVVISVSFLNLFPKVLFAIVTLISYLIRWVYGQRSQLIVVSGSIILCSGIFLIIGYGIWKGRYDINIENHDIYFDTFPESLNGLRVVQLSDIHLGSYGKNPKALLETVKIVSEIKPDLLLFTGDIVNNFGSEMSGFEPYLQQLTAKYGKFAILGNHDYGDYSDWPDSISKAENLNTIHTGLTNAGFTLLLNRWKCVAIKDTSICLIGVENWGHKPFPQYARLDLAMDSLPPNSFNILMSHDPAHWKSKIIKDTNIPLTLSGHTHGGQFSIKIAGIEFSPLYFYQKCWGGLYQTGNQYLYVNRGLGTIGYPGRIDMRPEITVLTLHRTKSH